jgi:hypothetical protein
MPIYPLIKALPLSLIIFTSITLAQPLGKYDTSAKHPFGQKHPDAPKALADYQPMIGESSCTFIGRNKDGTWKKPVQMKWVFKYIMNGTAVQDEIYKTDGSTSGSIRQYDSKNKVWFVHYYTSLRMDAPLHYWQGDKRSHGKIVLRRPQKSFSGKDGSTRLTFDRFKPSGFEWLMQWQSLDKKTIYPLSKISCAR